MSEQAVGQGGGQGVVRGVADDRTPSDLRFRGRGQGGQGGQGVFNLSHAPVHAHAHARTHEAAIGGQPDPPDRPDQPDHTSPAVVRGGRAVVDGVEHVMRVAKVTSKIARRVPGLSSNHHIRVWCECMSDQVAEPGTFPSGPYWNPARAKEAVASDPRRLGGWDALGVVDMRGGPSALDLFKEHIREASNGHR